MQLILREDIPHLGKSGELVKVKPGYGRNYLIPRGLAILATQRNVARLEHEKRVIAAQRAKQFRSAEEMAKKIESVTLHIARATGAEDKLFGSVTGRDIEAALEEQGVAVEHKKFVLPEPIKALGFYEIPVKLAGELSARIKLWVVKKA